MTTRRSISLVLLVLFPLFEAACYAHLRWKRNDILVRKRDKAPIYVASLAGWLAYFNLIVSVFGGVPCGLFYVASLLVAPICVGPQIIRALTLRGTIKYSQLVTEEEMSSRAQKRKKASSGKLPTIPSVGAASSELSERGEASSPYLMTKMMEANAVMERTREAVKMTKWALLGVTALLLILAISLTSNDSQMLATNFDECQPEPMYWQYASPAFGVASTALAWVVTILVKKVEDEIGLRREIHRNAVVLGCTYIALMVLRFTGHYEWQPLTQTIQQMMLSFSMTFALFLPESSLTRAATWAKNRINPATKSAVPGYAQSLPKGRTSTIVPPRESKRSSLQNVFGRQSSMVMKQNDQRNKEVAVSWDAGLCILLSTEEGINSFSQHCAREFSSENVRFWCAVNDYKAMYDVETCRRPASSSLDEEQHQSSTNLVANEDNADISAAAKDIYGSFLCSSSKSQVNLSSKMRSDIRKALDTGQVDRDTFDAAQKEIFAVMSRDSYPRFLASKKNRAPT